MKAIIIVFFISGVCLQAQNDSLHISATQADINSGVFLPTDNADQQTFQKYVFNDPSLFAELKGFEKSSAYSIPTKIFNGMIGGKFFFENEKIKNRHLEYFAGLRFGQYINCAASHTKSEPDTLHSYSDPTANPPRYLIRNNTTLYSFTIHGSRLYIPLGFNFTTNKRRFFWLSAGVECTPMFSFGHKFTSTKTQFYNEQLSESGTSLHPYGGSLTTVERNFHSQNIKGIGFGVYGGIPLNIYLHPFHHETNFLYKLNFFGSLMPLFAISSDKFSGIKSSPGLNASAGLRINL